VALKKRGKYRYGDSQQDIVLELERYSKQNVYVVHHWADAVCKCGSRIFRLLLDDNEGAAIRICENCKDEHPIGDSAEYLEEADLDECRCPCGKGVFEITAGVSLYRDSEDVRWIYIGCRCPACGLVGVYGDWKNEFPGYQKLLEQI